MPRDWLALADGLAEGGITHVALESTGEDWRPVYTILEGAFTVFLVNAAHGKQVPGRKTAKADARWLATRMRHGWLQASCIPPQGRCEWGERMRSRTTLGQDRSGEVNRGQGVLERATIKLAAGATAIRGVSGRAILAALIEGRTAPATRAALAKGRRRSTSPLLEQAVTGLMHDPHRRLLALQLAHVDFLDEQIETLRAELMRDVTALEPGDPLPPPSADTASAAGQGGRLGALAAPGG